MSNLTVYLLEEAYINLAIFTVSADYRMNILYMHETMISQGCLWAIG